MWLFSHSAQSKRREVRNSSHLSISDIFYAWSAWNSTNHPCLCLIVSDNWLQDFIQWINLLVKNMRCWFSPSKGERFHKIFLFPFLFRSSFFFLWFLGADKIVTEELSYLFCFEPQHSLRLGVIIVDNCDHVWRFGEGINGEGQW